MISRAFASALFLSVAFAAPVAVSAVPQHDSLLKAIERGSAEDLTRAIKQGSDLETLDPHGRPAIVLAAQQGQTHLVGLLLAHGAAPDAKNIRNVVLQPSGERIAEGRTALMEAAANGHGDTVQLLLAAGAAPLEADAAGQTAVDLAEVGGFDDLARLMRAYSGDEHRELPCELHGFGADGARGEQTLVLPVGASRARELFEDSMIAYGFLLKKDRGDHFVGRRLFPHFAVNMASRSNHPGEKLLVRFESSTSDETVVIASTHSPPVGRKNRQWTTAVLQHARCLYDLLDAHRPTPLSLPAAPSGLVLSDGTPIRLRLRRHLLSKTAEEGQPIELQVAADVTVDGQVVIGKGTRVVGKVDRARPGRGFGRRSSLGFSIDQLTAADGRQIPLRSDGESERGRSARGRVVAAALGAGVLGAWLEKGEDVLVRAGSEYSAFVDGDHEVGLSQAVGGPVDGASGGAPPEL